MSVKREEGSPSSSIFFCNFFLFKWGRSAHPTDKIRKAIFWSYLFAWILWDKINIDTHRFSHRHISKIEENKLVCHRRMSLKSCERKRWKVCFRWKPRGWCGKVLEGVLQAAKRNALWSDEATFDWQTAKKETELKALVLQFLLQCFVNFTP